MVHEIIPIYLGSLSSLMYPEQPRCFFIAHMGFGEPSRRFFSKDGCCGENMGGVASAGKAVARSVAKPFKRKATRGSWNGAC